MFFPQITRRENCKTHRPDSFRARTERTFKRTSASFYRGGRGDIQARRNAKKATKSKNATVAEYNRSTGFEAVIGYLYVIGRKDRIDELLTKAELK